MRLGTPTHASIAAAPTRSVSQILAMAATGGGGGTGGIAPRELLTVAPGVQQAQVDEALAAIALLPAADRQLLAERGLKVELVAQASVDGDSMIGATSVTKSGGGPWVPTSIKIAAHAGQALSPTRHIVVHEVGHAIEVLRTQDRSEAAAEAYLSRVLTAPADRAIAADRAKVDAANGATHLAPPTTSVAGGGTAGPSLGLWAGIGMAALGALLLAF